MEIDDTVSSILAHKEGQAIWSISPETTVYEAIQLMADQNIGALPVVSDNGLIGMISERDYTRKVILKGRSSRDTFVREIMTTDPVTVAPNNRVLDCMRLMTEHRIRHLAVLNHLGLIGILSIGDLVNHVISVQHATIDHLERYIFGGS
jgi:CBS domain-containing protein